MMGYVVGFNDGDGDVYVVILVVFYVMVVMF